jgi:hypothetical protein
MKSNYPKPDPRALIRMGISDIAMATGKQEYI